MGSIEQYSRVRVGAVQHSAIQCPLARYRGVDECSAQLLLCDCFLGHCLNHTGTRNEHVRCPSHLRIAND